MNIAMWVLAGGVLGWVGYAHLRGNRERGMIFSIIIGIVGGLFGGNVLAPMLGAVTETPNIFSPFALFVAVASAAACLTIGDMLSKRYRV
jgi:uncharacterized membrane protein YeaQ/YmgE (transglycosylase-associated protein family)